MPAIDARVAALVDKTANLSDQDEDALIDALEQDEGLDGLRERRLQQLHEEYTLAKDMRDSGHGTYEEIKDEKALMDITTSTRLCVIHFFSPDFNRCRIMDSRMEILAPKHIEAKFLKINVSNAPFLVAKLKIQVLPCVLAFVDGVSADRIVGFEGLGRGNDSFTPKELESRLLQAQVLDRAKLDKDDKVRRRNNAKSSDSDTDTDYDDDE